MIGWREIPRADLTGWNRRLLQEPGASIRQFPLFNEGLRGSGGLWVTIPGRYAALIGLGRRWTTAPRYLEHRSSNGATTFVSIVTIGIAAVRFGCILDGPVAFEGATVEPAAVGELLTWARRNRYIALRLTHSSDAFLESLSTGENSERIDSVPFYPYPSSELYVELDQDEALMLSRFQKIARQEIRRARDAGYIISIDHDPGAMHKVWSAFESRSAQKGISYRDLTTYMRIMREAEPHRAAHLYTASRDGTPIAAILVLRDQVTAHYFLGTINTAALGTAVSPACLLHWSAMRHAIAMGATRYNLGTRSGSVYAFKSKFRPTEAGKPQPLTFAANRSLYGVWRRLLPSIRRIVT